MARLAEAVNAELPRRSARFFMRPPSSHLRNDLISLLLCHILMKPTLLLERDDALYPEITAINADDIRLLSPIPTCIQKTEDGYFIATFFDAGIVASGPTEIEAFNMLRDTVTSTFRLFLANGDKLGRRPQQQLAILRQFISKVE
ncbi:MAG TPA: hypothetical protein VNH11_35495 [Pirellulales bacterium]|nr:hypothetical protein [Pirellulales bacterium]